MKTIVAGWVLVLVVAGIAATQQPNGVGYFLGAVIGLSVWTAWHLWKRKAETPPVPQDPPSH